MKWTLLIAETADTPEVVLNKTEGIFEIRGQSLPEDAVKFYSSVFKWMKDYVDSPNENTCFVFKLDYFNSASARIIIELISLLEEIIENGSSVSVVWYYRQEDDMILNRGREIAELTEIPFEIRTY